MHAVWRILEDPHNLNMMFKTGSIPSVTGPKVIKSA